MYCVLRYVYDARKALIVVVCITLFQRFFAQSLFLRGQRVNVGRCLAIILNVLVQLIGFQYCFLGALLVSI